MRLVYEKAAARALRALPRKAAAAIMSELEAIAADPFGHHQQATPLAGTGSGFRLRHGPWRALYRIDRAADTVFVEAVKHRKEACRR